MDIDIDNIPDKTRYGSTQQFVDEKIGGYFYWAVLRQSDGTLIKWKYSGSGIISMTDQMYRQCYPNDDLVTLIPIE